LKVHKRMSWQCEKQEPCFIPVTEETVSVRLHVYLDETIESDEPSLDKVEVTWTALSPNFSGPKEVRAEQSSLKRTTVFDFEQMATGWYQLEAAGSLQGETVALGKKEVQLNKAVSDKHESIQQRIHLVPAGSLVMYLYDEQGDIVKNARYRVRLQGRAEGVAENGCIHIQYTHIHAQACWVYWSPPGEVEGYQWSSKIYLDSENDSKPEVNEAQEKLHNLGYDETWTLDDQLLLFQIDHQLPKEPRRGEQIPPNTMASLREVYAEFAHGSGRR
jgi:hypothetical protein